MSHYYTTKYYIFNERSNPNGGANGKLATAAQSAQNLLDKDPLIKICKIYPERQNEGLIFFCILLDDIL